MRRFSTGTWASCSRVLTHTRHHPEAMTGLAVRVGTYLRGELQIARRQGEYFLSAAELELPIGTVTMSTRSSCSRDCTGWPTPSSGAAT
jgi:hypothetical protein